MNKRMRNVAAAGRKMVSKAPDRARRTLKTARKKAGSFGEMASNVAEKVTQVAATAAGAVVGTVQAVMPDHSAQTRTNGTGSSRA
jgi:hypothetical protein